MERQLRSGFTTGACAAAAARGAMLALVHQRLVTEVTIMLPHGPAVTFALHTSSFTDAEGRASVIKDAGDDPDVTDKAEIRARVTWSDQPGVTFRRGAGVGVVTKPGLPVPPGEPAINPVPRAMIRAAIEEVLNSAPIESTVKGWHALRYSEGRDSQNLAATVGVVVEISVPRGEEMAQKTFNPRLGITGGISILGTSGIVVPYSNAAWVASVVQAIDVAAAQGCRHLVLTVGGRSERAAQKIFTLPEVAFIQIGPFFGAALRQCASAGIARVSLAAMIGKLAKFAAGNESVHSTAGRQDFAFLARLAATAGADSPLCDRVGAANTAQEVAGLLGPAGPAFFAMLSEEAWRFGRTFFRGELEVLLMGVHGDILGRSPSAGTV
jgi:cobalt-precorrin-5B (C1)-methyltransferase